MKKGQSTILTAVFALPVIAVSLLITFWVYGMTSDVVPHDKLYYNESMCSTCINGSGTTTTYQFENIPVLNDTTMVCYNDSSDLMTNGITDGTCLGYNIINNNALNITNTSAENGCQISDAVCTYTHDDANTNEQGFYETSTSNINSSYVLGSVALIVFAAVIVVLAVFLLGKD